MKNCRSLRCEGFRIRIRRLIGYNARNKAPEIISRDRLKRLRVILTFSSENLDFLNNVLYNYILFNFKLHF